MRFQGWENRYIDVLKLYNSVQFEWGKHDCVTFAFDTLHALLGVDHFLEYRGQYTTMKEAYALLKKNADTDKLSEGFGNFVKQFDIFECPVLMAQRGDPVIYTTKLGETFGVIAPTGDRAYALGKSGLVEVSLDFVDIAWGIR